MRMLYIGIQKVKSSLLRQIHKVLKYNAVDSPCHSCYIIISILYEKLFSMKIITITKTKQKQNQRYDISKNRDKVNNIHNL